MNHFDPNYPNQISTTFTNFYDRIITFLPNALLAAIVVLLGWIIGAALGSAVYRVLNMIGIDKAADRLGMSTLAQRAGRTFSLAGAVRWLIKWLFIIGSIIAAADILGLNQVSNFFYNDVLAYAGHVIVAAIILMLGALAANFLGDLVEGAVKAGGMNIAGALGAITRWSIVVFAFIAALSELQIAENFLQDLFRAVIAMLAIAGGIAFGLGGRDHAKKVLDSVESNLTR